NYELIADADLYSDAGLSENHEELGKLFIELVRTRGQIAKAKGYENYMDMSYACDFKRDYTTAEARGFMGLVKEKLAPMMEYTKITGICSYYSSWNESKWEEMLSTAAEKTGGPIWESCRFLLEHELYDFSYSSKKLNIGYTDYIDNYEAPVIFVDPSGRDLVYTLFHEFGHFTDFYRNYGFSESYEIAETYSQAMQYLAFAYSEPFSDRDRNTNLRATLSDLLVYAVLREAAFADFELQVYSLPADELTQEKLDEVYAQCIKDYGLEDEGSIWTNEKFWIASSHFFSYPGYVISYSVSAVAALQICRMEAEEPGAGVDAYLRLLDRTRGKKFAAVIEEAELDSPFEAETIEKTAEFLSGAFELN
ncbi:MAG: hypothetical protein J6P98_05085, partial [Clostridia bacterium]|nr:hypothetical protein [Clostridia bacterium]